MNLTTFQNTISDSCHSALGYSCYCPLRSRLWRCLPVHEIALNLDLMQQHSTPVKVSDRETNQCLGVAIKLQQLAAKEGERSLWVNNHMHLHIQMDPKVACRPHRYNPDKFALLGSGSLLD